MDSRRWRHANVLAVDDQHANLVTLDAVLSPDFDVVRARSGEEALAILQARDDIDVILLDVQMPGMDGFEVAARVKQLPGCKDIPIVFVTAVYHEDPFVKQGYQVGIIDLTDGEPTPRSPGPEVRLAFPGFVGGPGAAATDLLLGFNADRLTRR